MKKFITGLLVGVMVVGSASVFAETTQTIEAIFGRVKLIVGGTEVSEETLLYNDVVYAPVQTVAEAAGKVYAFDADAQIVRVDEPEQEALPQGDYSRGNPAPVNTAQTVTVSNWMEEYTVAVRVVETVRGAEAWNEIIAANQFNDGPEAGYEYILAKIAVSVISVKDDKALSLAKYQFKYYSSTNTEYEYASVITPKPELADSLFTGGNTEGYVAFQVKTDDAAPKMAYGLDYDGSGGIWFSLQ